MPRRVTSASQRVSDAVTPNDPMLTLQVLLAQSRLRRRRSRWLRRRLLRQRFVGLAAASMHPTNFYFRRRRPRPSQRSRRKRLHPRKLPPRLPKQRLHPRPRPPLLSPRPTLLLREHRNPRRPHLRPPHQRLLSKMFPLSSRRPSLVASANKRPPPRKRRRLVQRRQRHQRRYEHTHLKISRVVVMT